MVLYAVQQKLSSKMFCLSRHFGTIMTIFAKSKYYLNFEDTGKSEIAFQLSKMKNCVTFLSSLKIIAYLRFFYVRNLITDDVLFMFLMERSASTIVRSQTLAISPLGSRR